MEACAGAYYMTRKLASFGHQVKLISPQFVRPFVKSNKNYFVDAEAICGAASPPAMRFVTARQRRGKSFQPCTGFANLWCEIGRRP
jgi:transposase